MARFSGVPSRSAAASAFALAFSLGAPSLHSQAPTWIHEFGSLNSDYGTSVCPVQDGGCLVAGVTSASWFPGAVDPDDIFLAKFDGGGSFLWGVQFGSSGDDWIYATTSDGARGVFLVGETGGSFDGPYAGGGDAWFGRCDDTGNRLWVHQVGTSGQDRATAVSPDGRGGVFVAGFSMLSGVGSYTWLARSEASGQGTWLRPLFTTAFILNLAPDGVGGMFAAGSTSFGFAGPHMGALDAWIGRFDADGNPLWLRQLGTSATEWAQGVAGDGLGGMFVAGMTKGSLGGQHLGDYDVWGARYDGSGNQLALNQFGTPQADGGGAITRDGLGGAYMTGNTNGSWGGPSVGVADAWVAQVDGALNVRWVDQFGSPFHDQPGAITLAAPGTAFVAGSATGDIPGAGGGGGGADAWVARYDLCYPDCNADGALSVPDFGCFQTRFLTADMYADCSGDGVLTVRDFGCFQTKFVAGCP